MTAKAIPLAEILDPEHPLTIAGFVPNLVVKQTVSELEDTATER